ncbi:unnamed protein product [Rhizoctonia solani]|uniref:Uncharacterized protein n=1 Tax=Rhizoctonia solani TaxID=456999 RepID=A0A8H3BXB0_9AGAM|nr:unnamed protein product [Rhizoctonia solani]
MSAVYTLLEGCFFHLDTSLWKGELGLLYDRVTNLMPNTRADQGYQEKAQPIANERDTSTVENDTDRPPNLNNIVIDLGEVVYSPLSSSNDDGGDGMGNNYGDYMHEAGSVDSLNGIINSNEARTLPGLNAGVHHSISKRYGHTIHPFAVVDTSQPESPTRPTHIWPRHYSSSSESSVSSVGSASTPALPVSSPNPLPNAVAALILKKKLKKERLAKVAEISVEQEKKAKETPEKAKRSKEDTVLDWFERESALATTTLTILSFALQVETNPFSLRPYALVTKMARPEDFQLRLTQWLLDQLDSHAEFETVSQQIGLLISQAQEQSVVELYTHIGELVFQKMTSTQQGGSTLIRLYAQLCCSLLAIHFRHYSTLSPRVPPIHEYILRLCFDSMPAATPNLSDNTNENHRSTAGVSAAHPSVTPLDVPIERICEIVLQLYDFQLISTVQVFEYMFRAFEQRKTFVGPKLTSVMAGMRLLLGVCFPDPYLGAWKNEVDCLRKWVNKHTNSSAERSNVILSNNTRTGEPHFTTKAEEHSSEDHRSTSSNNGNGFTSNSIKNPTSPDENCSQGQMNKDVKIDATAGNNYGSPPDRVGSLDFTNVLANVSETKLVQNESTSFRKSIGSMQSVTRGPSTPRIGPLANVPLVMNGTPSAGAPSSGNYRTSFAAVDSVKPTPFNASVPGPSQPISSASSARTVTASIGNNIPPKGNVHTLLRREIAAALAPTNTTDRNMSMKAVRLPVASIAAPPSHGPTFSSTPLGFLALGVQQWPCRQTGGYGCRVSPNYMDWDDAGCYELLDDVARGPYQDDADRSDGSYPDDYYPDEDDYYPDEDDDGGYY